MSQTMAADASPETKNKKLVKVVASNRRDIPVASFDFTGGAFAKSRKTRLLSLVALGLTVLLLMFTVYRSVNNFTKASSNNSSTARLKNTGDTIVSEFSTFSAEGTDTMSLVNKYNTTTDSLSTIVYEQADVGKFFSTVLSFTSPDLTVSRMDYNPEQTDRADKSATKSSIKVQVGVSGTSISAVLEFITRISSLELLTNVTTTRSGLNATVKADILMNNPPQVLVDKLSDLGIRYDKTRQVLSPVVVSDPTVTVP